MPESRESSTSGFLWILRKFQEHLFCRTSVNAYLRNEATKICFHINIFTEKHLCGCRLKYSCRYDGLEFYLRGIQSQILCCKICEVLQSFSFTKHYLLLGNCFWVPVTFLPCFFPLIYQQYINSVTTSCLGTPEIAKWKRSILLALKMFKGNQINK